VKKVLITGSNSFIGRALAQRLLDNFRILEVNSDMDISADNSFNDFENEKIDHIFHLAAKTFVPDSWKQTASFYRVNVLGTVNVLEFCRQKSIPLTFVSAYLYGQPAKLPIAENEAIQSNNPYAHSKYLAEQVCEFYAREFGVKTVIIRPFNVYGSGQSEKFLIPYIIRQALEQNEITVNDLAPRRDYVYIDDLIDALVLSMAPREQFAVYNIGSGYSLSVTDVIKTVQSEIGTDKKVVSHNDVRKNEIDDVVADISKAKKDMGWSPKYSFAEGIKNIIKHHNEKLHAETNTHQ
jgi:nucleoside-diphosphate-sugar epimerase